MSKNLSELAGRKGKGLTNNLFERMGKLAQDSGAPSKEDLEKLADEFLVGTANTYGTTTFYDFLKPENKGKKVYVCNGSTCHCAGTQDKLQDDLGKHFHEAEIGHMCCLGRCHENGAFHYDGKNYSGKSTEEIAAIVNGDVAQNKDTYTSTSYGTPILTLDFPGIDTYYKPLADALKRDSSDVLDNIITSGIRGRGGAGFPMGLKLQFCRNVENETKFIICNADEGDPGAYSDRYLLEERPHSVLFGMLIAGYVTHATNGVLYIRGEYPEAVDVVHSAIQELRNAHLIGENILGSGFNFEFKVIKAQGSYICGEETALINSIEGQRPEVRVRPPYPAVQGLFNKPTVVNNVETLATLHYILSNGGDAYKAIGTDKSTGTKLVSLDGQFNKPGVYEVEMGTSLTAVVNELGGGFKKSIKALHIGGPLGGLVPVSKIKDLEIAFESFSDNGFLLGHAGIIGIPTDYPMIAYLEHLFKFGADESCGKCFPCRLGTTRAHEMLNKAQNEAYKISRELFDDLLHTLEIGSLCAHGGGLPLPIRNALEYFEEELEAYFI
jgi:NADH:ubiquinone oxidoreductase subunit F (NADH-binding)/NADH:ubiquinone oxidoreductase subunit E